MSELREEFLSARCIELEHQLAMKCKEIDVIRPVMHKLALVMNLGMFHWDELEMAYRDYKSKITKESNEN